MEIKYICLFCNREFKRKEGLTQHKDYCQKDVNSKWYKEHKKECPKCGKSFVANREFCSRKCANSHFVSEEHKKKVSKTLKQKYAKNSVVRKCLDCGKEISKGAIRCISCEQARRHCEKPITREELKKLIRNTPFTRIGEQFGVSDNAIRKWCDSYNLPRKVSDIKKYTNEEWNKI